MRCEWFYTVALHARERMTSWFAKVVRLETLRELRELW